MKTIAVRSELPGDEPAIRRVNERAFDQPTEADIVDALRGSDAWLPALSIVAADESGIVGHALFSRIHLDTGPALLSLGPMAVLPDRQRAGVGTGLVRWGLERARATEYPLVVVIGHPDYYPRFGFRRARQYGIETHYDAPDDAWLALPLPAYDGRIRGTVRYPPAWENV
jgi:putative acetyltransferase